MILQILKLLIAILLAFLSGKLISKLKLPSILGWLIAGMILGPHALSLINQDLVGILHGTRLPYMFSNVLLVL